MKILTFMLSHSRRTVLLAVFAGMLSGAANTGLLALINAGLHRSTSGRMGLLWAFVGLCLAVPLARVVSELLLVHFGQGVIYRLRMEMSRKIVAVPQRHLEKLGSARLLSVLTGDIPTVANAVIGLPLLCVNLAVVLGCLVYMGVLSWKVLLVTLVFIALGVATYQLPISRAQRHFQWARGVRDQLYQHLRALTEGSKELKLHYRRRVAFFDKLLETSAAAYRRHQINGETIYTLAASWGQLLLFVIIGLLLFVTPRFSTEEASAETLTGYVLVLLYLMTPLQVIINSLPNLTQAEVALRRVDAMGLDLARHGSEAESRPPVEISVWKSLELRQVTHVYRREGEEQDFVLGPIDLGFAPGELIFLAGGNGSGKTTLGKVLVGLYTPEGGQIRLDGELVTEENRESYRQLFSVIFSDFYLFDKLLGLESPELDDQARRYLAELQLDRKVTVEGGMLSTIELSQGQRKRLALLTAYLEDRPIYVFDEWAADQDPLFKDIFYLQILPELKHRGKTVIVISHDDRYYHLADRVVKLDYGRIVAATAAPQTLASATAQVREAVL